MLEVVDLSFDYQNKPLLKSINFTLKTGGLLHLRGANGAGKTTLLKLLAGLLEPSQGGIRYSGYWIMDNLNTYRQNLRFVGHKSGISPQLTVRENCYFDLHYNRQPIKLVELLEAFHLSELENEYCGQLSAGQRRRVALLRLLLSDSFLWLLDEPLVALDQDTTSVLMNCLEAHLQQGGQVILTSHQQLPEADFECQEYCL